MRYLSSGLGRDGITINSIQFNFIEANQDGKWRNQCLESAMREKSRFHGTWWPLIRSRNCVVIAACRRPMHVIRERLTLIRNCLIYESIDFIVVKIHYPLYYKRFVLLLQAVPQIRNIDEVLNPNKFIYIEITYVSASHVHQTLIYEDGTNAILINKS